MITVRFETGFSVQYNSATYCKWRDTRVDLYTADPAKEGKWVATVPNTCIVEVSTPCRLYNPVLNVSDAAQFVIDNLRKTETSKLIELKRELKEFDSTQRRWKQST